ncbi:MAG: hypothetical protein U0V72_06635 [Cytophagales bacterium]
MKCKIYILFVVFVCNWAFAQSFNNQYTKAIEFRNNAKYQQSDSLFTIILKKYKKNLPEDLCYHYGVVLYKLGKTKQSKDFFTKYLSLPTSKSMYKDSSNYYLELMTPKPKATKVIDCDVCKGKAEALQVCNKCAGKGIITCYNCLGKGLVSTDVNLGNPTMHSCKVCSGKGSLKCETCKGQKKMVYKCTKCKGSGKLYIIE